MQDAKMRMIGKISAGLAAVVLLASAQAACAQTLPADENGRYTLSATDNGYLRLDTRTGAVSICTSKGGWTCRVVPDERAALDQEIGRLQSDIDKLKTQLASREETVKGKIDAPLAREEPLKKGDSLQKDVPERPASSSRSAPSQADMASALDWAWRRLVGFAAQLHNRLSEWI
jgi:hypothetical protein